MAHSSIVTAIPDIEPPRLIVRGVRVGHHFHELLRARRPDFDVALAIACQIARVAGAFIDDPIGQGKLLHQPFVHFPELPVHIRRLVRRAYRVHFDLVELMDALDAPDVLAPGSGLGSEARRRGEDPHRQVGFVQHPVHEVAEVRRFRRPDQEQRQRFLDVVGLDFVYLIAAFRELRRAVQRALPNQQGRNKGRESAPEQFIGQEPMNRHLHEGDVAQQVRKSGSRNLAALERIDAAEFFAEFGIVQWFEVDISGMRRPGGHELRGMVRPAQLPGIQVSLAGNPGTLLDVVLFALAFRHFGIDEVREPVHQGGPFFVDLRGLGVECPGFLADLLALLACRVWIGLAEGGDLLFFGVQAIDRGLKSAAPRVQFQPSVDVGPCRVDLPEPDDFLQPAGVRARLFGVDHRRPTGCGSSAWTGPG